MRPRFHFIATLVLGAIALPAFAAESKANDPKSDFFTTSDNIKIHYLTLGDRGSWVVLIHGYTGNAEHNWFANGIAQALAKNHRVVALDNRNHGMSDKPQLNGPGKASDVIELMDHLKIQKAHIGGYSMGGSITGQLLAAHQDRFITAHFGGSGIPEVDPEWIAKLPKDKEGRDPQEDAISHQLRINHAMDNGMSKEEAEKLASKPPAAPAARTATATPAAAPQRQGIDLTKVTVPVIAINGELDRPHFKTARMSRELFNFTNVVLPGKSHLTAIAGGYMPKEYLENLVGFINAHDSMQ
jgi:pimeloyl-ACP methyl ester carboxylesterase